MLLAPFQTNLLHHMNITGNNMSGMRRQNIRGFVILGVRYFDRNLYTVNKHWLRASGKFVN